MPGEMGNETPYVVYLRERVGQLIAEKHIFSIQQLAEFSGLKVTPNMRRRLRQWCDMKYLECWYSRNYKERGSHLVYGLYGDIPF